MKKIKKPTISDFDPILDAYNDKKISKASMIKQCQALYKLVPECREYQKKVRKKGSK